MELSRGHCSKMSENSTMEAEDDNKEIERIKTRIPRELRGDRESLQLKNRHVRGIILAKAKPSYALRRGIGGLRQEVGSFLSEHRRRLRGLLRRLVRRHNWDEASGVLSVLLKGTRKETSLAKNRIKYWATMELLTHMNGGSINSRKIQHVYELWMKKIGFMKNWPIKDRFAVQLEFILFCLAHGNVEDAHQAVIGLMQERGFGCDPTSILVVGLTFCQLWYCSIPEELQLRDVDEYYVPMESEMSDTNFDMSIDNSNGHDTVEVQEANFPAPCGSNTSIRIGKDIYLEADVDQRRAVFMELDNNLQGETMYKNFQPQDFYVISAERSGHQESSFSSHSGNIPNTSIVYARGVQSWLFPLRLPHSNKNMEYIAYMHRTLRNDYYKSAIKYLRHALYSTPPVFEALLPLVQMLLAGDQAKEALAELEKFVHNSSTALALRLKACLLEHFDGNNYVKLSACLEDILIKDPTCTYSLERLVSMHQSGDYGTKKLVEMIALHLDASYAESNIWKVFSSCFLNLSQCEEDRISVCLGSKEGRDEQGYSYYLNRLPGIFTDGVSRKMWRFRCRWWLTRHFGQRMVASDVASGDLGLLTYKAACASHLYGQELEYVVKASSCLEKEKEKDLLAFLQMHKQNSVGFYLNFDDKNK